MAQNSCHLNFPAALIHFILHFSLIKSICEKSNIYLPYDLTIPLLSIFQGEMKTYVHQNPCTRMFITAFFVIAPNWKQVRYPSKKKKG